MNLLKNQVKARMFAVLIPLLLVVLVSGALLLSRYLTSAIYAGYHANLEEELVTVEQALDQALMTNDFKTVEKLVTNMSQQGQMHLIRILDQKGTILASSIPDEIGIHLDNKSPQCLPCHLNPNSQAAFAVQHLPVDINDQPSTITAKPLVNQITCQSCHANAGATLGVILAEQDSAAVTAQSASLNLAIFGGAGVIFLLLAGIFWISFNRIVDHPLRSLAFGGTATSLAASPDEFGVVARQLKELKAAVKEKGIQLDAERRNLNALLTLSESIDVTLTTEKVLQFAISQVQEVTGFASVAMRLFEPDTKCFRLVAHSGMTPHMVEELRCIPADRGFFADISQTRRAAYTSDLSLDPRLGGKAPLEEGFYSLISVPFLSGERLMGSMELASKQVHTWSENEIRWLELMGRSIGNVLHHIQTSNQLQGLAVMQERSRIAQEIHDGLAQLIGTLRLWAEEAQSALRENDLKEAQDDLEKIELSARDAYASLREEILGLRDTISPGQGILPVIQEFLSRYQRQWGIETQLIMHLKQQEGRQRSWISPSTEIQLLRIIQEGLTNIRRHANASRVIILMEDIETCVRVEVKDNGQGFDPHNVPEEKLGLRIMRERAASVGGRVIVESSGEAGTCLTIELPRQEISQPPPWVAGLESER